MRAVKIYLAGGMRSGWQDRVARLLPDCALIDPRGHGLERPEDYTAWDLAGVASADIVLAYMHPGNPSGYGLCVEVGYAHALGKPIVFVDQMQTDWRGKYLDMVRVVSSVFPDFEGAAAHILRKASS